MERRLSAIIAADVVDYSRMIRADEDGTLLAMRALRDELIDPAIAAHGGRIVKLMGDGILAEFASVVDAVSCGVAVQQGIAERNITEPDNRHIRFRIGINLGDVVIDGDDIQGDGVNVAARLEALAKPNGICISEAVYEQVRDRLDLDFEDMGAQQLKNINRPVQAWRWLLPEEKATTRPAGDIAAGRTDKPSIAVLPFDNRSGDAEQEYFSDGITEDIITDLSKSSGLMVIARNSSFAFRGRAKDPKDIAAELGVRYLLDGSVRRAGNRLRINAELIDAQTGSQLWAERYDGDMEDIFSLQDRITDSIVATLAVTVTRAEEDRAMRTEGRNLAAYDYVLRGTAYHHRLTREDNIQARAMFEQAIALDPNNAPAYAGLAWVQVHDSNQGWSDDRQEALQQGLDNARTAVRLDDTLAKAHLVLGDALLWSHQQDQAVFEGRKAVALDPSYADGHMGLSVFLHCVGLAEESLAEMKLALKFNPLHANRFYYQSLSRSHYMLAQYELAAEAAGMAISCDTAAYGPRVAMAMAYAQMGRQDDAQRQIQQALSIKPELSLEEYRGHPMKNKDDLEHVLDGIRKSGLPDV